jgi:hypothetical protein
LNIAIRTEGDVSIGQYKAAWQCQWLGDHFCRSKFEGSILPYLDKENRPERFARRKERRMKRNKGKKGGTIHILDICHQRLTC